MQQTNIYGVVGSVLLVKLLLRGVKLSSSQQHLVICFHLIAHNPVLSSVLFRCLATNFLPTSRETLLLLSLNQVQVPLSCKL